jgi:hypothetical protein
MEQLNEFICELLESIGLTKKNALIIVGSVIVFWVWIGKPRTYVRRAVTKYKARRATRKATPKKRRKRSMRSMYRSRK